MNSLDKDNKKLANDILERRYYSEFRQGNKKLEIFLSGICKANCEYCYLKKHQKDLYPSELYHPEILIQNLQLILNWYIENDFHCMIDIFSAEWLTTPLADKVFECIYETFSKVPPEKRPPAILAADNMQFIKNPELTEHIQKQLRKINALGIDFPISASIDGKYCDYGRTENDDIFYQRLNDFMVKNKLRFHPMISADNIKYWIENYLWFKETFDKSLGEIMTLEVRNEDWNEESIGHLIQYCDFLIDYTFEYEFNYNKKEFLKHILRIHDDENDRAKWPSYNVIGLECSGVYSNTDHKACSFSNSLAIRLGDLSVAPCHRLFYPELEIGKFNVVDNKIIDFTPTTVELLILLAHNHTSCLPHCEKCKFNGVCIGFCSGASYEEYGNMLVPQIEVCKMYQAKLSFLIYKYYTMGLFDELENLDIHHLYKMYLKDLINSVIGGLI